MHIIEPAEQRGPWDEEWQAACGRRTLSQGALRLLRLLYDLAGERETISVPWTALVHELQRADATVRGWRATLDDAGIIQFGWNLGPRGGTSRQPGHDLISIRLCRAAEWRPEDSPAWMRPGRADARQHVLPFPDSEPDRPTLQVVDAGQVARDLARPNSRDLTRATELARDLARPFATAGDDPPASEAAERDADARANLPGEQCDTPGERSSPTTTTTDTCPTNERTISCFARAYHEGFGPAFTAFAGELTDDGRRVVRREPTRRERFELMRLAVVAVECDAVGALLNACEVTRRAKIEVDRLNHLKGTFARLAGLRDLFARLDPIEIPEGYLRRPETAPNGEEPQRE